MDELDRAIEANRLVLKLFRLRTIPQGRTQRYLRVLTRASDRAQRRTERVYGTAAATLEERRDQR